MNFNKIWVLVLNLWYIHFCYVFFFVQFEIYIIFFYIKLLLNMHTSNDSQNLKTLNILLKTINSQIKFVFELNLDIYATFEMVCCTILQIQEMWCTDACFSSETMEFDLTEGERTCSMWDIVSDLVLSVHTCLCSTWTFFEEMKCCLTG